MVTCIIISVIAYFIGSINFSIIISKKFAGFDIRDKGSGNAGTTNMLRTVGRKAAIITLVLDILKGVVAIVIAYIVTLIIKDKQISHILLQLAGIFVIIGHTFPIFFTFKGGKAIATTLGVLLMVNWQIGLICLVFALVLMVLTRIVSVGSCAAAVLFPVLTIFIHTNYLVPHSNYLIFSIIVSVIILFNHRENIKRLMQGKENKLSFKK